MPLPDHYATLGVAPGADADEIKKVFRRLARRYHPDVSKEPDAAQKMASINEAYNVLSDAERRAEYDAEREMEKRAAAAGRGAGAGPGGFTQGFGRSGGDPSGFSGFSGFGSFGGGAGGEGLDEDEFAELMERVMRQQRASGARAGRTAGRASARSGPQRGEDAQARLVLDLADSLQGAERRITMAVPEWDAEGRMQMRDKALDLRIPKGIREGQRIRLAGQGGPGFDGGPAGDLLLEVTFRPHPDFRAEGGTLIGRLPLAPWEAALGAVVPVTLPDGSTLKVRVPADAQPGRVLRVPGRGLSSASKPGDLELHVAVVLPSSLDPRARTLYEQMAKELPDFDARKVARFEAERSGQAEPDA